MPYADETAAYEPLSTTVTHALNSAGVAFSVHPSQSIDPAQRMHVILLQHLDQLRLALIPHTHILDLAQLNTQTNTMWQAATTTSAAPLLKQYNMTTLPAIPALCNMMPCFYAPSLLAQSMAYLEFGVDGMLLGLTPKALKTLLTSAQAIDCSHAVTLQHPNHSPASDDAHGIQQAVINLTSRRIQQRLEETLEIPLLSSTAKKVLRLRTDPLASIDELSAIVETDPPLAAQVMSWAASPYYATPSKIRSVEDAIMRVLGFDLVINLALGLSLGKHLKIPADQPQHSTPYWQQAIYVATLTEGLVRAMPADKKPDNGLAYLAGLLHNFGFALLAHVFPPHFSLVCRSLEANLHLSHSVVEYDLLGITREQMGAWLMQCWDIPSELIYALRYQDNPNYEGEHASYANLVCLAQRLLAQDKMGQNANNQIPNALYERLGISQAKAQDVLQHILDAEQALRELAIQFNHS
jgi:HD-like signal output (HDOD) protein/prolyl-tRNA editing enzyme YbaK/EbsC (Cys-tRNA(Pro) deacylase)